MRTVILIAVLLGGVAAAEAAPDDFIIETMSNAPAHQVGQKLAKGDKVKLPVNARITVRDRTKGGNGEMRICSGPYDGPIEKCSEKPPATGDAAGGVRGVVQ